MLVQAKNNVPVYRRETIPFLGLNRGDETQDGEFSEQKNMSARRFPYLAPRLPRAKEAFKENMQGLFYWDGHEVVVAGGTLYLDGTGVFDVSEGPKQFAVVNTKLIVWPDRITVDLTNREVRQMYVEVVNQGTATFTKNSVTLELEYAYTSQISKYYGWEVYVWTYSSVSWDPETKQWSVEGREKTRIELGACQGRYFIPDVTYNPDTNSYSNLSPISNFGGTPKEPFNDYGIYGKFEEYSSEYADVGGTRFQWTYGVYRSDQKNAPLGDIFGVGDIVTVSNTGYTSLNRTDIPIKSITGEENKITFADNTFGSEKTITSAVKIARRVPNLAYICEHENRLWGVSNEDNTIFSSELGKPYSFYNYSGDAGSYSVAVGSEGDFTGICSYGNAVLCWKERALHKVLGNYPSNYQTAVYRFAGVRSGAHKSLVNVNETLFFLGVDGVYAYTGNKPSLISRALGASVLKNGVGGTDGRAYYLSVQNGEKWELLSYDTHTGLWTRSDETCVMDFSRAGDAVKFLSGDSVYTIGSGDESVEWEAVFVPMYETLEGDKQYRRLLFRLEIPKDGWVAADVRFDDVRWTQVGIAKGHNGPIQMPVPLRRCDKFQIRLRGKGDCAVLEMVREFRLRGDS